MRYACGNEPMIGDTVEVVDDKERYGKPDFKIGDRLTVSEVIPNNQGTPKTVEYLVSFLQYPTDTTRDCDRFRLVSRATAETPKQEATKSLGQVAYDTIAAANDDGLGGGEYPWVWDQLPKNAPEAQAVWDQAAQAVVDAYKSRSNPTWVTKELHEMLLNKLKEELKTVQARNLTVERELQALRSTNEDLRNDLGSLSNRSALLLQVKDQLERKIEALSSSQKETENLRIIELLQDRENYRKAYTCYVEVTERLINELNRKIITLTKEGA